MCTQQEVITIEGDNSAGQAAVFLAATACQVHVLICFGELSSSMSRYLIRRTEDTSNITLPSYAEVVKLIGGEHLEQVELLNNSTGERRIEPYCCV